MNHENTSGNIQANNAGMEIQSTAQQIFCCECGARLKPEAKFCTSCGKPVEQGDAGAVADNSGDNTPPSPQKSPQPQTPAVPPALPAQQPQQNISQKPAAQTGTLTCASCGNTLSENAKFCIECGTGVSAKIKPQYRLVCKADGKNHEFDLRPDEHINIGKAENCIIILEDDDYVSRTHARLYIKDGIVWLEDMNSSNGTFVRIDKPVPLKTDSHFVIGKRLLVFEKNNC